VLFRSLLKAFNMLLRWLKNVLKKSNKTFLLPVKKETSSHGLILKQKNVILPTYALPPQKMFLPIRQESSPQTIKLDFHPCWDPCRKSFCLCHWSRNSWSCHQQSVTIHQPRGTYMWQCNVVAQSTTDERYHLNYQRCTDNKK